MFGNLHAGTPSGRGRTGLKFLPIAFSTLEVQDCLFIMGPALIPVGAWSVVLIFGIWCVSGLK